jgi:hypothetical protein
MRRRRRSLGASRTSWVLVLAGVVALSSIAGIGGIPAVSPSDFPASHSMRPSHDTASTRGGTGRPAGPEAWAPATASPTPLGPALRGLRPEPAATPIDPFLSYSHEPAPMGIADFGLTAAGPSATPYTYATPSFEGTAVVRSMHLTPSLAAFELNAMLVFRAGGRNFTYWIQNGLHVDTGTGEFTIGGAYVWNFSAPGAHLSAGELRGNGSSVLAPDTYYFIPGCGGFAGQCSYLAWPDSFSGRIAVATCTGYPCVLYQYDLGAGWVTYDAVSFLRLAGAVPVGFLVDGGRYTPLATGTYYDAEWVWVAAGGGTSGQDTGSDLGLSLSYWNGHNYQVVPAALDFGGDTGETSSNVSVAPNATGVGGAPQAQLSSGPGSLGMVYGPLSVGALAVSSPEVPNGTLTLDGNPVPFRNGSANLTLAAGTYALSLQNYSNATASVSILSGGTTSANFSGAGRTVFEEQGLPPATPWGLSVAGANSTSTSSTLSVYLANGSYTVRYLPVPGYRWAGPGGPVPLSIPASSPIVLRAYPFTYAVRVNESGLPNGTSWWISLNGSPVRSTSPGLEVMAPNGSTPFTAGAAYEFEADPSSGSIFLSAGSSPPIEITFTVRPTYIAGTVYPPGANVTIGGIRQAAPGGAFNDSVLPGTYVVEASAPGYNLTVRSVNATAGNVTYLALVLTKNRSSPPGSGGGPPGGGFPSGPELLLVAGLAAVGAVGATALLVRRRRQRVG